MELDCHRGWMLTKHYVMKHTFAITPRVIAHLGEDLIKNESIALVELVKNSYDAQASFVKLSLF